VSLGELYRHLGDAVHVSPALADRIVKEAKPSAAAALGRGVELDVTARRIEPEQARGGSLIPAWPLRAPSGAVTIEFVNDWGVLLAGWLSCIEPRERDIAERLVRAGQRVWIGIANDVLQLFVTNPPPGSYSMVRHHALMLTAATLWLGPEAVLDWRAAHTAAARAFVRGHGVAGLWDAIAAAERGLDSLLADSRARQPSPQALAWLEADGAARLTYQAFLGAASLGVAAALLAFEESRMPAAGVWLRQALIAHAEADFNRAWIDAYARGLTTVVAAG
jgi:hypothetical protein